MLGGFPPRILLKPHNNSEIFVVIVFPWSIFVMMIFSTVSSDPLFPYFPDFINSTNTTAHTHKHFYLRMIMFYRYFHSLFVYKYKPGFIFSV